MQLLPQEGRSMTDVQPGAHMRAELTSQPETWAKAAELRDAQAQLPASGARIAVVGCGTSWFMATASANLRERAVLPATSQGLDPDHPRNLTRSVVLP
jgi:glucosamine 6-phosphate synthetase-like amidotransferase/phosphosugar isomerase protein